MTIVKDPKVTNTGESDAYVFIRFRIPHDRFAAQGTFENIVVNTGYRPEHPELWPPIVDSREAADFTEKLGQCTDFDEYCQGPVDTSNKDLFKKLGREFSVTCIRDESPSFV